MTRPAVTPESSAKSLDTLQAMWKPGSTACEGMTVHQLQVQRDALRKALERLDAIRPNCDSCSRFDFHKLCSKHGEVPAEFRHADGECADWVFDHIPF